MMDFIKAVDVVVMAAGCLKSDKCEGHCRDCQYNYDHNELKEALEKWQEVFGRKNERSV